MRRHVYSAIRKILLTFMTGCFTIYENYPQELRLANVYVHQLSKLTTTLDPTTSTISD